MELAYHLLGVADTYVLAISITPFILPLAAIGAYCAYAPEAFRRS